ncbi:MAG: hypothetical protein IT429_16940, partial [Gemmataceae bacterium]|nr:hypothetical protein [Gemmataceae bacterium]
FSSSLGETLVVWLDTDASLSQAVELPVTRLRAVDRAGTARVIADGDDGAIDGAVTLVVTTEPLIIRSLDGRPLRRV